LGNFLKNPDAPAPLAHGAKPLPAKICHCQMFPARFRLFPEFKKRPAVTNAFSPFVLSQPLKAICGKQTSYFFPPPGTGLSGLPRVNEYLLTFCQDWFIFFHVDSAFLFIFCVCINIMQQKGDFFNPLLAYVVSVLSSKKRSFFIFPENPSVLPLPVATLGVASYPQSFD
jgi:hypothetical protein